MSSISPHHRALTCGIGKCSVPMWSGYGTPAGFCDAEAYGERPPSATYRNGWTGEERRIDGRYNGYVPGLACPVHGGPERPVPFLDGDAWCAVRPGFVNLQESPAGFGATPEEALAALSTPSPQTTPEPRR